MSGDDEIRRLERAVAAGGGYEAALRLVAAHERLLEGGEPRVVAASRAVLRDHYWAQVNGVADVLESLGLEVTFRLWDQVIDPTRLGWITFGDGLQPVLNALPARDPREVTCFGCGPLGLTGGSLQGRAEKVFLYDACSETLRRFQGPQGPRLGSRWILTRRYPTGGSIFEAGDLATVVGFATDEHGLPAQLVRFDADFDPDDGLTEGNFPMSLEGFRERFVRA